MQSIFCHMTGHPYCRDPTCRLFSAHWQAEMIQAQLDFPYEFFPDHDMN